ncbi:MAG: transposase [Thermoplasmatales archaeon]
MSKRRSGRIRRIAHDSPENPYLDKALKMEISSLIRILKALMDEREMFENAMKSDTVTDNHVIMSIPGIGPITGSVILGKICNMGRFENAEKPVAFAGIDPVIKESGKQRSEKLISKRGDSALRSAIYQSTRAAVRMNPVISEFYHRKVDCGMPKKKALVAASRKQCHIIWSVWHNNRPYEIPEKFRKQE